MAESASSNISGLMSRLTTTTNAAQKKRSTSIQRKKSAAKSAQAASDTAARNIGIDGASYMDARQAAMKAHSTRKGLKSLQKKMGAEKAFDQSLLKGAQFGANILGDEGLGRMGSDADVQESLSRFKGIADQGLSRGEVAAERAQAFRDIDSQTQTGMRGLQAQLARSGVKGAVAGQQLIQRQMAGAQLKADKSQELFLTSEGMKRQGLKDYSSRLGEVKSFDLGQAAKEKNLIMQSGLTFAQMGSSERAAKTSAAASVRAAQFTAAGNEGGGK